MKRKNASVKMIVDIYNLKRSGNSVSVIATSYGCNPEKIYNIYHHLKRAIQAKLEGRLKVVSNYTRALDVINSPKIKETQVAIGEGGNNLPDRFDKLNHAFESFQNSISEFVTEELSYRTKEIIDDLNSEIDKVEQEKEDLKKDFEDKLSKFQKNNWIENLRLQLKK